MLRDHFASLEPISDVPRNRRTEVAWAVCKRPFTMDAPRSSSTNKALPDAYRTAWRSNTRKRTKRRVAELLFGLLAAGYWPPNVGHRPSSRLVAKMSAAPPADRPRQRRQRGSHTDRCFAHLPRHVDTDRPSSPAIAVSVFFWPHRCATGSRSSNDNRNSGRGRRTRGRAPLRTGLAESACRLRHSSRGDRLPQRRPPARTVKNLARTSADFGFLPVDHLHRCHEVNDGSAGLAMIG